jgi:radical SAM C-methyltransferase
MAATSDTKTVSLVQQGIWDMPMESMPLAAGYLKATALCDDRIRQGMDLRIWNYRGGVPLGRMADELFADGGPDVLAFSVLGWNHRTFGCLAETAKQLNPDAWVMFGGTHVANQAERVFRTFPDVDVVVNGEGEFVFRDLLRAILDGVSRHELAGIAGISYQGSGGEVITTRPRERIEDLETIPSPVLTGAIDLTDAQGRFRYDVALMETNRGCPYKCSFCYWGGATGQRMRAFSRERLRQELELYARLQVHTVCLCDSNFGMLPIDLEFVDDLIEVRERYGYPRALETSWAKNKSKVFYEIVRRMTAAGLRSSFTLALQSLSDDVLHTMNRKNMKLNEFEDLAAWLGKEGLDCYAELIWGAPGETVESFMTGYDRLARHVSRIAVYPVLLLPNTEYFEKKKEYGIVSVRGDLDDFEYVLAHDQMSFADNKMMQRFIFWSRVLADAGVLRASWVALRQLAGLTQSQVLRTVEDWILRTDAPAGVELRRAVVGGTAAPGAAIDFLYRDPRSKHLLTRWWEEAVRPALPPDVAPVVDEVFRFDLLTQPVYRLPGTALEDGLTVERLDGERYYRRTGVRLSYDIPAIIAALRAGAAPDLRPRPVHVDLRYRAGVETFTATTNSEEIVHYMGTVTGTTDGVTGNGWPARS